MEHAKSTPTPLSSNIYNEEEQEINKNFSYRELIRTMLYLSNKTRPDIIFAVGFASRHMENPLKQDVINVKTVLTYLNGKKL